MTINVLLAVGVGLLCLAADSVLNDIIVTPLLSLCWLMILALKADWKRVVTAFAILAIFVAFSFSGRNASVIFVRTSSFALAGMLAAAFSRARQRSISALASAHAIIRGNPTPMIAADMTGAIVAFSDETLALLSPDFIPIIGHSFADVFMGNLTPGRAMKKYLDWFHQDGSQDELLFLRGQNELPLSARILTIGEGRDRLLVAVIQNRVG